VGIFKSRKLKKGLRNKLIWNMLAVGAVPLMLAVVLSYTQGTKSLQGVVGASFKALAYETSTKIDLLIQGEVDRNVRLASEKDIRDSILKANQKFALVSPTIRNSELAEKISFWEDPGKKISALLDEDSNKTLKNFLKRKISSVAATQALYVTDSTGVLVASANDFPRFVNSDNPALKIILEGEEDTVYISSVYDDPKADFPLIQFAFPVLGEVGKPIGVLFHVFNAKSLFSPSIEPITFGKTGHVMLIDSKGVVIDCPILPTGFQLTDPILIQSVTQPAANWVKIKGNGHGGKELSIIGFSPLSLTQNFTSRSTGKSWHIFAWQSSEELFAPMRKLFFWISTAAIISILLIGIMGSMAAKKIVWPILQLQRAAVKIGKGEQVGSLKIKTGDEIEALADEVNSMSEMLQRSFSGLKSQVRQKTQEFRYLKEYTDSILMSVPDAVAIFDIDLKIEYVNAAFENTIKNNGGFCLGKSLLDLSFDPQEPWQTMHSALKIHSKKKSAANSTTTQAKAVLSYVAKDPLGPEESTSLKNMQQTIKLGDKVFAYKSFDLILHERNEKHIGLLLRDVTEEVDLHDQLTLAEKLSGLGTLTAGIAHELNNPLVSIMGFSELLLDEKEPKKIKKYAKKIIDQSKHMSSVILNMSGYTRISTGGNKAVDINERIDAAIEIAILATYKDDIFLERNFSSLPPMFAKPEEIQQIFINLLANAVQAMAGKGRLAVVTQVKNGKILIKISDDGPGIPQTFLPKIYDPFFTTKEQGQGTGLGLSIVHQLVEKYGGKIEVSSSIGEGTTFSIILPTHPG